jgi:hypothetical protein
MKELLKNRLHRAFALSHDLVSHLPESTLELKLPELPSNTVREQLWCLVGARESYLKAIREGGWKGFACSLPAKADKETVLAKLGASRQELETLNFTGLNAQQAETAFSLLEHELQHHGQLIRYVYGNKLSFPVSWNKRYTV